MVREFRWASCAASHGLQEHQRLKRAAFAKHIIAREKPNYSADTITPPSAGMSIAGCFCRVQMPRLQTTDELEPNPHVWSV